jgi:hypothetical protein
MAARTEIYPHNNWPSSTNVGARGEVGGEEDQACVLESRLINKQSAFSVENLVDSERVDKRSGNPMRCTRLEKIVFEES